MNPRLPSTGFAFHYRTDRQLEENSLVALGMTPVIVRSGIGSFFGFQRGIVRLIATKR